MCKIWRSDFVELATMSMVAFVAEASKYFVTTKLLQGFCMAFQSDWQATLAHDFA